MNVYSIGADILQHWHWVEPRLKRAIKRSLRGDLTTGHYLVSILNGEAFIGVVEDAGEVQTIVLFVPSKDTLHMEAWEGKNMGQWVEPALAVVDGWAKGLGCKYITSKSRPGAAKILQKVAGYQVHDYYMKKEVSA